MKCKLCGKETGATWKELCLDCFKKEVKPKEETLPEPKDIEDLNPAFCGMIFNNAFLLTLQEKPSDFFKKLNENYTRTEAFAIEKWKQRGLIR